MCITTALILVIEMFTGASGDDVLRVEVQRNYVNFRSRTSLTVYASVLADRQQMNVLVDTGSFYLFWVWKQYYEGIMGKGACDDLFFNCYECPHPCEPTDTTSLPFDGGTSVEIFKHSGSVNLEGRTLKNIDFGLVCKSDPSPSETSYPGILGLGFYIDAKYPSLLEQLINQRVVRENVFALYLKQGECCSGEFEGELLLGGGDATLYKGPLEYVSTVSENEWFVGLSTIKIGAESLDVADRVILDTGSNSILVPQLKLRELIKNIAISASESVGYEVSIEYDDAKRVWAFDCEYIFDLPTLNFMLSTSTGGVPLSINSESYVGMVDYFCYLQLHESKTGKWTLPDYMLVGNYLEFQPQKKRVGIAKLK